MRCKNCGQDVKSDFKFCPYCAQQLVSDFQDPYNELQPPYDLPDLPDEDPEDYVYGESAQQEPSIRRPLFEEDLLSSPRTEQKPPKEPPYQIYVPGSSGSPREPEPPREPELPHEPELPRQPASSYAPELPDALALPYESELPDEVELPYVAELPEEVELPDDPAPSYEQPREYLPEPQAPPARGKLFGRSIGRAAKETKNQSNSREMNAQTLESAPYVPMQPEQGTTPIADKKKSPSKRSPGLAVKLLLILFAVCLGYLLSYVGYRLMTKQPLFGNTEVSFDLSAVRPRFAVVLQLPQGETP